MTAISDSSPAIAPHVIAGLLLAARDRLRELGLRGPSAAQIVEKTGATRSCAYEAKGKILELLPSVVRPIGRPPAATPAPPPPGTEALSREALRFVMAHPGCVYAGTGRRDYADSFRLFVLDLHRKHPELGVEDLARAVEVPVDTLRDWMRAPAPSAPEPAETDPSAWASGNLHIQTVLEAWAAWEGGFAAFCDHVREHLRVPYGRTAVGSILSSHGARTPRRRQGRSPDEKALRESFETFFAGAQWVADGTPVLVTVQDETFGFNVELGIDAHTGAFTGLSIRDEEDSTALLEAIANGKVATGAPPLAVEVDNRPSNLAPEVGRAFAADGTLVITATKGRPQNKAHAEGGFGLFRQMAPPLVLPAGASKKDSARQLLRLVVTTWARTLNHRPRDDRGGKSRVSLYQDEKPTPEQVAQARAALRERLRRQEAARRTLQARQDPLVRSTITKAFARFGIVDPTSHQLDAIARYPLSAVVDGIAVFEGKRAAGSLPRDLELPGRYLLGIVRNIAEQREAEQILEATLRLRLEARDALLAPLVACRREVELGDRDASQRLVRYVDLAMLAERRLDRLFWLSTSAELVADAPAYLRQGLHRLAALRIHAYSRVPYAERLRASRLLGDLAAPLD